MWEAYLIAGACAVICWLAVFFWCHRPDRQGRMYSTLVIGMVFGFLVFSPIIFFQSLLTLVVIAVSQLAGAGRRTMARVAAVALLSVQLWSGNAISQRWAQLEAWRREFPVVSLMPRLKKEPAKAAAVQDWGDLVPVCFPDPLSEFVEQRLLAQEEQLKLNQNWRSNMLERLHTDTSREFDEITGFGPVRMIRLSRRQLTLPEAPPVPQSTALSEITGIPPDGEIAVESGPVAPTELLFQLHDVGSQNLLDPASMGWVRGGALAAGFRGHRFTQMPHIEPKKQLEWKIDRLELVGLISRAKPVAYVTEHLPDLEKLGDAATRPLNEFELDALSQLSTETDLVIDDAGHQIRMVGALRAGRDCLMCHTGDRGDVLGAFSYVLRPADAP